jgi:hypothetical protein
VIISLQPGEGANRAGIVGLQHCPSGSKESGVAVRHSKLRANDPEGTMPKTQPTPFDAPVLGIVQHGCISISIRA